MKLRIATDSSSDITPEEAARHGIEIMPLTITFDGVMYKDKVDITTDEFYRKLTTGKKLPSTSQQATGEFLELFNDVKEKGDALLLLVLSSNISGSYQNALIAKEMADYGEIYIVDSLNTIGALKMMAYEAAKRREEMTASQLAEFLNELKGRVRVLGILNTLEYLAKGGRLHKGAALIGGVLNIKPVITVQEGFVDVIEKPRGVKAAFKFVHKYMQGTQVDESFPIVFGYSMTDERCGELAKEVLEKFPVKEYFKSHIGAVVGTHIGPGASAVVYVEKKKD